MVHQVQDGVVSTQDIPVEDGVLLIGTSKLIYMFSNLQSSVLNIVSVFKLLFQLFMKFAYLLSLSGNWERSI